LIETDGLSLNQQKAGGKDARGGDGRKKKRKNGASCLTSGNATISKKKKIRTMVEKESEGIGEKVLTKKSGDGGKRRRVRSDKKVNRSLNLTSQRILWSGQSRERMVADTKNME